MIELRDVCKYYQVGDDKVRALDHANLHIYPHEFVSIIGPSGSGKSTLMNIIGCLDTADAGIYLLDGTGKKSEDRFCFPEFQPDRQTLGRGKRRASADLSESTPLRAAKARS